MNWMMLKLAFERLSLSLSLSFLSFPLLIFTHSFLYLYSLSLSLVYLPFGFLVWLLPQEEERRIPLSRHREPLSLSVSRNTHNGLCDVTSIRQRKRSRKRQVKRRDAPQMMFAQMNEMRREAPFTLFLCKEKLFSFWQMVVTKRRGKS